MKLMYCVQEQTPGTPLDIIGIFSDVKNALQCASDQINEGTSKHVEFNIVECPINKSLLGGIIIHTVKYYKESLSEIIDVNPIYTYGGIKKWASDQRKAAKKS